MSRAVVDEARTPRLATLVVAIACALIVSAVACIMLIGGSQCGFRYGLTLIYSVWPLFGVFLIGLVPFAAVLNTWVMRRLGPISTLVAWFTLVICASIALVIYAHMPFPNAPAEFTGVQGQLCSLPDF